MKRFTLTLLALVVVGHAVQAAPPVEQHGRLGIYADPAATVTNLRVAPNQPFDLYLVLTGKAAAGGIRGWECAVTATPNVQFLEWTYEGRALNLSEPPRFLVGLGDCLPAVDGVVLAQATVVVTDERPVRLTVQPHPRSSTKPPAPACVVGDPAAGLPVLNLSAGSGFEINGGRAPAARLQGNTPNPFNPRTEIRFAIPDRGPVRLAVYSLDGRRVATLLDAVLPGGSHAIEWAGRNDRGEAVASGTYIYRLETGGTVETRSMVLLK